MRIMRPTRMFLLLVLFPAAFGYTDESINLLVRPTSTSDTRRYCVELARLPNNHFINVTNFDWYSPYLSLSSVNACRTSDLNNSFPASFPSNTILILYEHSCKITEQAWNVQNKFGNQIVLMIITERTNTKYELTYNILTMPVTIPVLMFWKNDFIRMSDTYPNLDNVQLSIDFPPVVGRKFRPAVLLMFLLVFLVLLGGNSWAADEFKEKTNGVRHHSSGLNRAATINEREPKSLESKEAAQYEEPAVIPINCCAIVLIIVFAVGWLLLLFYFPKVMIYILQVMFCIGAFSCLSSCLNRLSYFAPVLRRYKTSFHTFREPCTWTLGPVNLFTILTMSVALTLVIIWYVYRQTTWAWILQDILGATICITVISTYRLGNMRVITIILLAFFLYDIFFVFITPYIPIFQQSSLSSNVHNASTVTPSNGSSSNTQSISRRPIKNPSVMEQVALGIGTNGEVVPLLFSLPMFIPESDVDPCTAVRMSMLGFGDVILPGILLTFCKIFDLASTNRWPIYYIQSVVSYFVGLSLTHVALYLMDTAQPALLYLVPCLLLSTILTSICRGELKELYTGNRIQSLLDGTAQNSTSSTYQGVTNPVAEQDDDELPRQDIAVGISDTTRVHNF